MENEVRERLLKDFPDAEIDIDFADGKHMAIEIKSDEFMDKTLLDQHKMVNQALAELINNGSLHAMKLKTRTKK